MRYMYEQFIPKNARKIDKVILMANYASYSKADLQDYIDSNRSYFCELKIPIVYIGQTKSYKIEAPVAAWLWDRYSKKAEDYERSEGKNVNNFLKNYIEKENYVNIMEWRDITFSNGESIIVYDTEHYSIFGTEQFSALLSSIFVK